MSIQLVDSNGVLTPDAMAAGARIAPPPPVPASVRRWRVAIQLGGVLPAESRAEASEVLEAALQALSQSIPGFVDLEATTTVQVLPNAE